MTPFAIICNYLSILLHCHMFTIYLPNAYHIHTNVLGDVYATKIQEDICPALKDAVFIVSRVSGVFLALLLVSALLTQRVGGSGG